MTERASQSAYTGFITIILTLAGWTAAPLMIKWFTGLVDFWTQNGWRYGMSALIWLPFLLYAMSRRKLPAGIFAAAAVPAIINAGSQTLFTWAHYQIDPGLLTFGLRAQIIMVTIGAALLFPAERAVIKKPLFLVGLGMVVAGVGSMVLLGKGLGDQATLHGLGLAILSGLGFGAYALAVRKYMHGMNSLLAFAAISQYTAAAMLACMFLFARDLETGQRDFGAAVFGFTAGQFLLLLLSAVVGIALGHVLYYYSIGRLGVTVSAGVIQLQPFTVSAISVAFYGERLSAGQWGSGLLAVAGAVLILVVQHRARHAAKRGEKDPGPWPADHVVAQAAEAEPLDPPEPASKPTPTDASHARRG